jgi:hypothetical protein
MTLKEKIAADIAAAEERMGAAPASFEGQDWFQLSEAEEEVFVDAAVAQELFGKTSPHPV